MLGFWQWFIIAGLAIIATVLYRRLIPRVDIIFTPDPRYVLKTDNVIRYRVDLINRGDWQERVSFRLDSVRVEDGEFLAIERKGFQREAGKGPMPLKEPKFGYIAEFDSGREDAKIMILTISDKASDYQDDPLALDPNVKWLVNVSLNPRIGQSCQRCFRIWLDDYRRLQMAEV